MHYFKGYKVYELWLTRDEVTPVLKLEDVEELLWDARFSMLTWVGLLAMVIGSLMGALIFN